MLILVTDFPLLLSPNIYLPKFLLQMEQMVLFTQMKSKGHLWESPRGKTVLSAASLLETLAGLMV